MDFIAGVLFGTLQGFTEFLPISSSGHLAIAAALFPAYDPPGILFEVILHAGTVLAVLYKFWPRIKSLNLAAIKLLVIGTIPAAFFGLAVNGYATALFASLSSVAIQLVITGVLNIVIDRTKHAKAKLTAGNSLAIGVAQAIAILPGISRSGATIFMGRLLGIPKKEIAEFSFLLLIPAVVGANILELAGTGFELPDNLTLYIAGFLAAFVSGLVAIKLVFHFLTQNKFTLFGVYSILLGLTLLIFVK